MAVITLTEVSEDNDGRGREMGGLEIVKVAHPTCGESGGSFPPAARIAPVGKEGTYEEYEYLRSIAIKITGVGVSEKAVVDDTLEPPSAKTEKIGAAL